MACWLATLGYTPIDALEAQGRPYPQRVPNRSDSSYDAGIGAILNVKLRRAHDCVSEQGQDVRSIAN